MGLTPEVDGDRITVDVSDLPSLDLSELPDASTVVLAGAGTSERVFSVYGTALSGLAIEFQQCRAAELALNIGSQLRTLRLRGVAPTLTTVLHSSETLEVRTIDVAESTVHVETHVLGLEKVALANGGFVSPREYRLVNLSCEGSVRMSTAGLSTDVATFPVGAADIEVARGFLSCTRVAGDRPIELTVRGRGGNRVHLGSLPRASKLHVWDSQVVLSEQPTEPPRAPSRATTQVPVLRDLAVDGDGDLVLLRSLERPVFSGSLTVSVQDASVYNARGNIRLYEASGALLQGDRSKDTLAILSADSVQNCEFEHISLYSLDGEESLLKIGDAATRLVPWMPWTMKARLLQSRQWTSSGIDDALRWHRIARFWKSVEVVLAAKHASGSVQSDVRVLAMRSRRRALSWSHDLRERSLLSLYAVVGYGERILTPLFVWVLWCVVATVGIQRLDVVPDSERWWLTLTQLLAAPLVTFRIDADRPNYPGFWDTAIFSFSQLLGVVLIGFSLLATRRVLRPETKSPS